MGAGASLGVRLVGVDVDHSCSEEDFGGHVERLTVDTFRTIDESCKDSSDRAADESCCTMDSFSVDDSAVSVLCLAESFQLRRTTRRLSKPMPKHALSESWNEADWIRVSDEEQDSMEESFKVPRRPQLSLGPIAAAAESYRLTDSGAIWIKGGDHGATARIQPSGLSPQSSDSRGLDDAATAGEDEEGDDLFSIIDRAVLLEPLGRGASGQVHKALDLSALRYVAIKSINVQDRSRRRQLATELQTLHSGLASRTAAVGPGQRGDARHVVRFFDAFAHAPTASVWLMVEYADGGSLEELVTAGGVRDHALLATLFRHAARGLRFLHATRHVHRDIKPANCLLTRRGGLKISDFGVACRLAEPEQPRAGAMMDSRLEDVDSDRAVAERHECSRPVLTKTQSFVGTSTYMSPERIGGDLYSTAADIWSLGCTFIAVATGIPPFRLSGANSEEAYWTLLRAIKEDPAPTLPADEPWSPELRECLRSALRKDDAERATACELLREDAFLRAVACEDRDDDYDDDDERAPQPPPSRLAATHKAELKRLARHELDSTLDAVSVHLETRLASAGAAALPRRKSRGSSDALRSAATRLCEGADGRLRAISEQLDLPQKEIDAAVRRRLNASARPAAQNASTCPTTCQWWPRR